MRMIEKRKTIEVFDPTNMQELTENFESVIQCPDKGLCVGNLSGICVSGAYYIVRKADGKLVMAKKELIHELYEEIVS